MAFCTSIFCLLVCSCLNEVVLPQYSDVVVQSPSRNTATHYCSCDDVWGHEGSSRFVHESYVKHVISH
jgi:hypothetical protein